MAKSDKFYFENYSQCADLASKAASYLVECFESYNPENIEEMLVKMHEIEHAADMKKHEMNQTLAKAFVTPVDREDLDMLSKELDDVLDIIEEVLQKLYIYDVQAIEPAAIEYAKNLVKACSLLTEIMGEFESFKKSKKIHSLIVACNDVEEDCDKLYLKTMGELTKKTTDVIKILAWHQIYDCLESCADACEHVSECVESIIMKNS